MIGNVKLLSYSGFGGIWQFVCVLCGREYERRPRSGKPNCRCCKAPNVKHGLSYEPEYQIWKGMKRRCDNPNEQFYKDYGGRGITYCRRFCDPALFYKDLGPRPEGLTIERKNNDGHYTGNCSICDYSGNCDLEIISPDNCRWATPREQNRNMRDNVYLTFLGHRLIISDWAEITGLHIATIQNRRKKGWADWECLMPTGLQYGCKKKPWIATTDDLISIESYLRNVMSKL